MWALGLSHGKYHLSVVLGGVWAACNGATLMLDTSTSKAESEVPKVQKCMHCVRISNDPARRHTAFL